MSIKNVLSKAESLPKSNVFSCLSNPELEENRIVAQIAITIMRRRKELGYTQKKFAEIMGVSQSQVSQWESGDVNFQIGTITKIYDKLNLQFKCYCDTLSSASGETSIINSRYISLSPSRNTRVIHATSSGNVRKTFNSIKNQEGTFA